MANFYTDDNGVFINKYGITDKNVLSDIEYAVTNLKITELHEKPIQGDFNQEHLEKIHKHLFEDIYGWAGKTRDVQSAKTYMDEGQRCRTKFCHPDSFSEAFDDVKQYLIETNNLKKTNGRENFVEGFVDVQRKLNHIHPFPEGNGRSLQVFMQQLAKEAGYDVDYSKITRDDWNLANGRAAPEQMKFFGHEPIEKKPNTQMLSEVCNKIISLEKILSPSEIISQKKTFVKERLSQKFKEANQVKIKPKSPEPER